MHQRIERGHDLVMRLERRQRHDAAPFLEGYGFIEVKVCWITQTIEISGLFEARLTLLSQGLENRMPFAFGFGMDKRHIAQTFDQIASFPALFLSVFRLKDDPVVLVACL